MKKVDYTALDALWHSATSGEWKPVDWCVEVDGGYVVAECHDYAVKAIVGESNAALIAALHNAWPDLLTERDAYRAALASLSSVLLELQEAMLAGRVEMDDAARAAVAIGLERVGEALEG